MDVHPTLRFHRINVAFFKEDGSVGDEKEIILEDSPITTIDIDVKEYAAVLPNFRDYSFIKVVLDDVSGTYFKTNFTKLQDPLTKGLVLRALYDGVRDATFKATDFLSLCFLIIEHEQSI